MDVIKDIEQETFTDLFMEVKTEDVENMQLLSNEYHEEIQKKPYHVEPHHFITTNVENLKCQLQDPEELEESFIEANSNLCNNDSSNGTKIKKETELDKKSRLLQIDCDLHTVKSEHFNLLVDCNYPSQHKKLDDYSFKHISNPLCLNHFSDSSSIAEEIDVKAGLLHTECNLPTVKIEDLNTLANHHTSLNKSFHDFEETDDSINDSNYLPYKVDDNKKQNQNIFSGQKITSLNGKGLNPCDDSNMYVKPSQAKSGNEKRNFCLYCFTKQTKIARHLALKHKDEESVKKFLELPKNSKDRRKCIEILRKEGNYLFNSDNTYNDGELIVTRRPNSKYSRTANEFRACGNCKAYFSRNSLRIHFRKCTKKASSKKRTNMILSKKVMGRIHPKASKKVRNDLFPHLREDDVVRAIRYDELVITYANKMVLKYKSPRYFQMIRQRIRLIGRFLIQLRNIICNITNLSSVYDPIYIDDTLKAINIEAGLNKDTYMYERPTVVSNLGTIFKQVGNILIAETIKNHDEEKKERTKNFLLLLNQEIYTGINQTVAKSHFQEQQRKKVEFPSLSDVKRLHVYLSVKRYEAFDRLSKKFSMEWWCVLSETTLVSIQVFNRRRAGEVEIILVDDFNAYTDINKKTDKEIFKKLSAKNQKLSNKYVRFLTRGKLNRNVPVLLDQHLLSCVKLILKHRLDAKVPKNNPYVFGLASNDTLRPKYLRACRLLKRFASKCGAQKPNTLCGTHLRKQIADQLNLTKNEISQLAEIMGHKKDIHKTYYRQYVACQDILKMSKLLQVEQGQEDSEYSSEEEEEVTNDIEQYINKILSSHSQGTKKRSTSPYRRVKRIKWTHEEKNTVLEKYKIHIKNKILPSLKDIDVFIKESPALKRRKAAQVKTWIYNQFCKTKCY